jgi:hypothetical protein
MSKIKAIAFGLVLLCAAQAFASESATATGEIAVKVDPDSKIMCTSIMVSNPKDVLLSTTETSENARAGIYCDIDTNLDYWNLKISAANGGKLINRENSSVFFTTDLEDSGKLGENGSVWVRLASTEDGVIIKVVENNDTPYAGGTQIQIGEGRNVNVSSGTAVSLPDKFVSGKTLFITNSQVKARFDIKAGVKGTKITAPAGIYSETITLTLTPDL